MAKPIVGIDAICKALATYLTELPGIGKALYPYPSTIPQSAIPAVMIEPVSPSIENLMGSGARVMVESVRFVVLQPRLTATTGEDFNVVNSLWPVVADALTIDPIHRTIGEKIPNLPSVVHSITLTGGGYSEIYMYGGNQTYAAATVTADIKYTRYTPGV